VRLLYIVTAEYDGTDEHGFAWNDPTAGVAWPEGTPLLSERDRSAPSLPVALERLGGERP
jgi:dTDP-4-dehydrorhamnose 3,5-epimerase